MTFEDIKVRAYNNANLQANSVDMMELLFDIMDRVFEFGELDGTKKHPTRDINKVIDDTIIYHWQRWTAYEDYCEIGEPESKMWSCLYDDASILAQNVAQILRKEKSKK